MLYYAYKDGYDKTIGQVCYCVDGIEKDLYGFAYKEDDRNLKYFCEPTKGRIKDSYFYEYKRDGKTLKKNGVSIYARYFTDTYDDAVIGFNILVRRRLERLREEIKKLEGMLITEE